MKKGGKKKIKHYDKLEEKTKWRERKKAYEKRGRKIKKYKDKETDRKIQQWIYSKNQF